MMSETGPGRIGERLGVSAGAVRHHLRSLELRILPLVAVAALVAATVVAAGSLASGERRVARAGDPAELAVRVVQLIAANRYDEAWEHLHPRHRRAARRAEYVACESLSPIPGTLETVEVLGVSGELVHVPGLAQPVEGKTVRVRAVIAGPTDPPVVVEDDVHVVPARGRWAWILPPERFDAYAADRCGEPPVSAA